MEKMQLMTMLYDGIENVVRQAGFEPEYTNSPKKNGCPAYERGEGAVLDFCGAKGVCRFVYNDNRIHLLFASKDAERDDDSAFTKDSTYLFELEEYGEKDVKSLVNEVNDYMNESFIVKKKAIKTKAPTTVSRTAAKSGLLQYDSITLATKIAGMFPNLKEEITKNVDTYGEFLCEDFFVNHANEQIMQLIKENHPQKMKRLFNILGEIYEDGTNEVQSVIAVTILGPIQNDPEIIQRIMPYLTDTMLEPCLAVNEMLKKSKSSRMRLENPPKYKPPKKKKKGFMERMMGADMPQQ